MEVLWQLRTEDRQHHTNALSKYENNSQWGLNHRICKLLLAQPELGGWRHDFGLFAGEHMTKGPEGFTLVTGTPLQGN